MLFFACHSVLICVCCMEHSDSESDFELHQVDPDLTAFLLSDAMVRLFASAVCLFDQDGYSEDVFVTGTDGACAACSAAIPRESIDVSTVRKQTISTSFFK